ncbi:MAG: hypothetical protein HY291_08940 [Planctomycetes bacterium]|nr:hypothetical protein [Planctomycetota bacterium]
MKNVRPPLKVRVLPKTERYQRALWLALLLAALVLLTCRISRAEGDAPKMFDGGADSKSLEDRLRSAYDEYQKKSAASAGQQGQAAGQQGGGGKGGKNGGKPMNADDAAYKEKVAQNQASIKEMFAAAEAKFKEGNYREAASFYASVVLANVAKTEQLVDDARKRFIEMEGLAQEHLKAADDADLQRDFMKEVEELAVINREFPFTKVFETAQRRLVSLKTRPDVAGSVEFAEGESLEASGNLVEALKKYKSISTNPRFENSLAAMKAKRKLETLEKNEATRDQLKNDLQALAEKQAPALISSAKNFLSNNMPAQAKEKLRAVMEKYPGTTFAEDAKKQLDQIP